MSKEELLEFPGFVVELLPNGLQRIERGLRRLRNEGDLAPEQGAACFALHAHEVAACKQREV